MILAPLRGVTIRAFREAFAAEIAEAGFTEAFTPFIPAMTGFDPLKDRELRYPSSIKLTPQFIGKDPAALAHCLERIRAAGYDTADLNCGCPFPMVRNKGRGSGLLRTPKVLEQMLEAGCRVMGAGKFSIKARLGVERPDELLQLMPLINAFPLRCLTVHGRVARQMYEGECDRAAVDRIAAVAKVPVVLNGDVTLPLADGIPAPYCEVMVGRAFVRSLGERENAGELLLRYIEASRTELSGDRPVLGRIKELMAYWKDLPRWRRRWQVAKLAVTVEELKSVVR